VVFWSSSATLAGNRPVGVAADVLLSALLARQALRTLRQRPSRRDLWLMIAATGALLLVSRMLAVRGSPFLYNNSDALVIPVAVGWAIWSGRFVVPVPVLLIILASWTGDPGVPAVEQAASALGLIACTASGARLLRAGAQQADADADDLSRKLAAKDAALAAEEAGWRAANAVHDDVLSVLRAAGETDQPPPWDLVVAKAKRALDAVALQVSRGGPGPAGLGSALRRQAIEVAAELDVRCDVDDDLLAPGFLTPSLAERVRTTRAVGARIVLRFERRADAALAETARKLLAATLAGLDTGGEATLQLHPAAEGHTVLLVLHVRNRHRGHAALRRAAAECGALISDLGDHELLIRLESAR
jgi:hypothetical protein